MVKQSLVAVFSSHMALDQMPIVRLCNSARYSATVDCVPCLANAGSGKYSDNSANEYNSFRNHIR